MKEITVPREWFERLNNMFQTYSNAQGNDKDEYLDMILGYISSVETILQIKK